MTDHLANIADPNGWLEIRIDTNQDASADGSIVLIDNFRVTVPREPTEVNEWSLY
ncbi:MAG: hypothetical protein JXR73_03990 [Candidatus Omnitrophica bacterium]|nr:hypothetical protein [Candidatus Omnitrophota bacterium]